MIILDTNIVAAQMLDRPDATVQAWIDNQDATALWLTTITIFEVRVGLLTMPSGKKQSRLALEFERLLSEDFEERILSVETEAATEAARITANRRKAGRPVELRDTLIGGIAVFHRAAIATRNTRHFDDLPITVINPWNA